MDFHAAVVVTPQNTLSTRGFMTKKSDSQEAKLL